MSIRNNHWYNLNEQRNYPLDDKASGLTNDGRRLPNDIIQDIRIRWPATYGQYAFVSAVSVTPHIVTVMIEVAKTIDNADKQSTLIAGISVPLVDLAIGQTLSFTPFRNYVGGFITFGNFGDRVFSGLFGSPLQSLLTARAARYTRIPPIPSIGIENSATALSGVVNFTAVSPLKLTKETRVIDGIERDNVIVFSLTQEAIETQQTGVTESVFRTFAGECGKRVGARSCDDPQPIETINGVGPDCDGVLTLEFTGCAVIGKNIADCGVIVDCNMGLSSSCNAPYLPALADGKLPSESPPILKPPPIPPEPPVVIDTSISESVTTVLALPYCDTFDDGIAYDFTPVGNSLFGLIGDDSPEEAACCVTASENYGCSQSESFSVSQSYSQSTSISQSMPLFGVTKQSNKYFALNVIDVASSYGAVTSQAESRTNISLFNADVQTLYRQYTTDLKITTVSAGGLRNAGIVANYKFIAAGVPTYYLALVDIDNAKFGIYFFNGVQLIAITQLELLSLKANDWYRLSLKIVPTTSLKQVAFVATLTGITNPAISATISASTSANNWGEDSGKSGFYAKRSRSYFSYWRIDEASI